MSELRNIALAAVADRESSFADSVKNLTTGFSFMAEIQGIEDITLNEALGIDPRASDMFFIRDKTVSIRAGDKWLVFGTKFEVLPRNAPDNPVDVQLKVYCQALVKGKDSGA